MAEDFEPKILGFLCNWCCYAAADSAGVSRIQYPPNLRTIRVMCTGRMDPLFFVEAFCAGVDGVFTGGWRPGECHYQVGNYEAMLSFELVKKILGHAGVSLDRLALDWASASEAPVFVDLITAFTRRIKELGPLGQAEGLDKDELRLKLSAAREAVKSVKLRMRFGKLAGEMRQENDYSPEAIEAKIEERAHEAILKEMDKQESALRTQGA